MIAGCTATARLSSGRTSSLPEIEWMLPSNISPTRCPLSRRSAGCPELPPTMSLLVERSNGVFGFSRARASIQLLRDPEGLLAGVRSYRRRQ